MQTDELIQRLAGDLQPVRRVRPLAVRLLGWGIVAVVSFVAIVLLTGARRDLAEAVQSPSFAFEAVLLILTGLSAAAGALIVSIPGAERTALIRWVPIVGGVACILWVAGELAVAAATGGNTGRLTLAWGCVYKTASVAAVPSVALFAIVRRAAPLKAAWAGLLALLATSAVGVLGANVICPIDRPLHMLLWHVAPLMLFGALGAGLGTWLLRWDRRLPNAESRS